LLTVSVATGEVRALSVALIDVVPAFVAVASPFDPPALLIVAMESLEELQVTDAVTFCVEASV
jgi:hypothetical protein